MQRHFEVVRIKFECFSMCKDLFKIVRLKLECFENLKAYLRICRAHLNVLRELCVCKHNSNDRLVMKTQGSFMWSI